MEIDAEVKKAEKNKPVRLSISRTNLKLE